MPADWLFAVITKGYTGPGMSLRNLYDLAHFGRITDADAVQRLAWASEGVCATPNPSFFAAPRANPASCRRTC